MIDDDDADDDGDDGPSDDDREDEVSPVPSLSVGPLAWGARPLQANILAPVPVPVVPVHLILLASQYTLTNVGMP